MRVVVDCRQMPSDSHCTLTITGEEQEVLRAATQHAIDVHGHVDSEELREGIRAGMQPEAGNRAAGFGTTMVAKLTKGSLDDITAGLLAWEDEMRAPGFIGAQIQVSEDGTLVNTAVFTDRDTYYRLADDPAQDRWYQERIAPYIEGEPRWIDGDWQVLFRAPAITLPQQSAPRSPAKT